MNVVTFYDFSSDREALSIYVIPVNMIVVRLASLGICDTCQYDCWENSSRSIFLMPINMVVARVFSLDLPYIFLLATISDGKRRTIVNRELLNRHFAHKNFQKQADFLLILSKHYFIIYAFLRDKNKYFKCS